MADHNVSYKRGVARATLSSSLPPPPLPTNLSTGFCFAAVDIRVRAADPCVRIRRNDWNSACSCCASSSISKNSCSNLPFRELIQYLDGQCGAKGIQCILPVHEDVLWIALSSPGLCIKGERFLLKILLCAFSVIYIKMCPISCPV